MSDTSTVSASSMRVLARRSDVNGGQRAYVAIGAYGGIGQVMLDGAAWNLASLGNVDINIGHDGWCRW